MEHYDPQMAARVWQRVTGQRSSRPTAPEIPALIAAEQESAQSYLHLSRMYRGKTAQTLQRIARQKKAHAAFLLSLLKTGQYHK